jgi:ATP-dependent Clp protease ATP-binding subunit ClpC
MATFRFPILIWRDFGGFFTARAVGAGNGYFPPAAFAETKEQTVWQVKEYLKWFYENEWWREPIEITDVKLIEFRVDVRPEYIVLKTEDEETRRWSVRQKPREPKKRSFPATETLPLRVACVYWREGGGNYFCSMPLLDIEFYFYELGTLKNLATTYAQEALKSLTPQQLAEFLPPREIWLEEITVTVKRRERNTEYVKETPNLLQVAEPLGAKEATKKGSKAYEREREVADLTQRLIRESSNIILQGENGVGKTTVLTEAVRKIEQDLAAGKGFTNVQGEDEFDDFYDEKKPRFRFWQTNGSRMIAGMKYLGQWEERCETVIAELTDIEGVLCVENLLDLAQVGGREPKESVAAFMMPYLQRGELRMVAEATKSEIEACRRLLPGFADLFQIVKLPEFTREKALSILNTITADRVRNNAAQVEGGVTNLVYRLFSRFMPYQTFPGPTTRFLTDLFEQKIGHIRAVNITTDSVIEKFVKQTGLPEIFLRDEFPLALSDVVSDLESQVIGQPNACQTVANVVTTFKAGLNDPQRPLGVLLFVGQTGVGKTELAKALSRFFYGHGEKAEERLIRLDMSEYSLPGSAWRLLTNSDGQPSELIQKVRQQPFCVVLFDEIEKADSAVFDVLLSWFDEGRLTDRFGRVTNFRSAVIIMTSNLGAEKFGRIGFGEHAAPSYEREAQTFFRPEFFNRLDFIVRFNPLNHQSLLQITEKELRSIARREGLESKGIKLVWTTKLVEFLAERGFDARYGARPLQRTIETIVTAPMAKFILQNSNLKEIELKADLNENKEVFFTIQ